MRGALPQDGRTGDVLRRERRLSVAAVLASCVLIAVLIAVLITPDSPGRHSESAPTPSPAAQPDSRTPIWSDEFDGPAGSPADPANWTYETGGGGWGNDELQYYTAGAENGALDGAGNLVITLRKVDSATTALQCWYGPCQYTSARLITGQKQEFQYGRVETRVMVPGGGGVWPAVWLLGSDIRDVGWPQSGEIDLMEFVGRMPNEIFGTLHGPGYSGGQSYSGAHDLGAPVEGSWHEFAVEWAPDQITWEVDGVAYHRATPSDVAPHEWVFDHRFFLLANMAIGGNFGGQVAEDVAMPRSMVIDYIRVYSDPG
ncbi:glycoside hydrolase family 16 protein [Agromyces sp. ISL-38]|uniref:glycoside hydrolase family 16 protein n=1 Tax=Agromyces sp. ISL-38 TaxID=2819107 RepID=UPI0027DEEECF|nr:glycoside hydrolase family 16 protein [Agromyces sp. ISL-38]